MHLHFRQTTSPMATFNIKRKRSIDERSTISLSSISDPEEYERRFFEEPDTQTDEGDVIESTGATGTTIKSRLLYTMVCFTLNNYNDDDMVKFQEAAEKGLIRIMFYQHEIGVNKTKHLQGFIHLNRRMRLSTLKYTFGNKVHFEKALGTPKQNWTYCTKKETRDPNIKEPIIVYPDKESVDKYLESTQFNKASSGVTLHNMLKDMIDNKEIDKTDRLYIVNRKKLKETLIEIREDEIIKGLKEQEKDIILREWQQSLLLELSRQTDREILWIWDYEGNNGKSFMAQYLWSKGYFRATGKTSTEHLAKMILNMPKYPDGICYDIPKSSIGEDGKPHVSYSSMENAKNGYLFSGRYEGVSTYINPLKVLVFANCQPDFSKMSKDRWRCFEIIDNKLVATEI